LILQKYPLVRRPTALLRRIPDPDSGPEDRDAGLTVFRTGIKAIVTRNALIEDDDPG
jgi:hypothetical protein